MAEVDVEGKEKEGDEYADGGEGADGQVDLLGNERLLQHVGRRVLGRRTP